MSPLHHLRERERDRAIAFAWAPVRALDMWSLEGGKEMQIRVQFCEHEAGAQIRVDQSSGQPSPLFWPFRAVLN